MESKNIAETTAKEMDLWYYAIRYMPKKLIYFCFMHVLSEVTTGKYSKTNVTTLTAMEAIDRYAKDNEV